MAYSPVTKKVAPMKENVRLKQERRKVAKAAREERRLARRKDEFEMLS